MKKLVCLAAIAAFTLVLIAGTAFAESEKIRMIEPEQATKAVQVIHLNATGGITPAEAVVKPGTTVVWLNESRTQLELQFEGKQVTIACKSPVHFIVDDSGSFVSDRIPEDSVASLCFVEKGEFPYMLRNASATAAFESRQAKPKEFKGKIIVK